MAIQTVVASYPQSTPQAFVNLASGNEPVIGDNPNANAIVTPIPVSSESAQTCATTDTTDGEVACKEGVEHNLVLPVQPAACVLQVQPIASPSTTGTI